MDSSESTVRAMLDHIPWRLMLWLDLASRMIKKILHWYWNASPFLLPYPLSSWKFLCLSFFASGSIYRYTKTEAWISVCDVLSDEVVHFSAFNVLKCLGFTLLQVTGQGLHIMFWWFTWKAAWLCIWVNVNLSISPWWFFTLVWHATKGAKNWRDLTYISEK